MEFADKGFAATRLEDVAKRAGIVKGTIYRYFDSKEALFEQAVASKIAPTINQVGELVDQFPGSTNDLLKMVIHVAHTQMSNNDVHALMRIMIAEGHRFPAITELYYRETVSRGLGFLERIAKRGIERGEFRPSALTDLPMIMLSPAIMATVWKLTFDAYHPIETEKFLEAHTEMLFKGLLVGEDDKGDSRTN